MQLLEMTLHALNVTGVVCAAKPLTSSDLWKKKNTTTL